MVSDFNIQTQYIYTVIVNLKYGKYGSLMGIIAILCNVCFLSIFGNGAYTL